MSSVDPNDQMNRSLISHTGSERATGGNGNKIVTFDGVTHVVWQDVSRRGYLNQIRSYHHDSATWTDTQTLNIGVDNHARPVITVDHSGYLHIVFSGHGSPVTYRRSTRPNDANEWTETETVGSGTYPIIICAEDDTLYLTVRAGDANSVDLYRKPPNGTWQKRAELITRAQEYRGGYAAFHNRICLGPDDMLHFICTFYEGTGRMENRGLHQAVCYMRSPDCGITWETSDATPVSIPARPEQMDIIAQSTEKRHEPMPQPDVSGNGLIVSSDGTVHILCLSHRDRPGEIVLYEIDRSGNWEKTVARETDDAFPDMRVVACSIHLGEDDTAYILATLAPLSHGWIGGKRMRGAGIEEIPDNRAVWLLRRPKAQRFDLLSEIEPGIHFNSLNAENALGANRIPKDHTPSFIHFDGTSKYPGGLRNYFDDVSGYIRNGELITNNVYWVSSRRIDPGRISSR